MKPKSFSHGCTFFSCALQSSSSAAICACCIAMFLLVMYQVSNQKQSQSMDCTYMQTTRKKQLRIGKSRPSIDLFLVIQNVSRFICSSFSFFPGSVCEVLCCLMCAACWPGEQVYSTLYIQCIRIRQMGQKKGESKLDKCKVYHIWTR